jgi:hypothetical protein
MRFANVCNVRWLYIFSFGKHFIFIGSGIISLAGIVWYMQSGQLRASNLSKRYDAEAGYNRRIYYYFAYFAYTLLPTSLLCRFNNFFS